MRMTYYLSRRLRLSSNAERLYPHLAVDCSWPKSTAWPLRLLAITGAR